MSISILLWVFFEILTFHEKHSISRNDVGVENVIACGVF